MDRYGYIGIETLLNFCENSKDHSVTPNDFMRMKRVRMPERKKDAIQKFHDYQVEWLLSHCDLELEPQLEEWVVRFLHDTANCYMIEMDRGEGEQDGQT